MNAKHDLSQLHGADDLAPRSHFLAALRLIGFAIFAGRIALFRMRLSVLYPHLNDVNSDFYVYQVIGNSWAHGKLPYRDVYDVKGPFFYLLFGIFAQLRAWSDGPALAVLWMCALASLWLAFRIARRYLGDLPATLSALASGALIYLTVRSVPTSFSCEELAVPGVLLLLWLVLRALDGEAVAAWWWVLDGAVFGALFWAKYQVIAPWGAVLLALLIVGRGGRRGLPSAKVGRIVVLNLAGCAIVTVVTLVVYASVLDTMLPAYFVAKVGAPRDTGEFVLEGRYVADMVVSNPIAVGTVCLALVVFLMWAVGGSGQRAETHTAATVFAIAMVPSMWAAIFGVRHPTNVMVPLCFVAVALPMALRAVTTARLIPAVAGVVTILAFAGVVPSIRQSQIDYGLGGAAEPVRCLPWPSGHMHSEPSVTAAFVRAADRRPILSINSLFAARALYQTRTVQPHRFEFVDPSWVSTTSAEAEQLRYLRERTFRYVWIRGYRVPPSHTRPPRLALFPEGQLGSPTASEAAVLDRGYVPFLVCGAQVLLRSR